VQGIYPDFTFFLSLVSPYFVFLCKVKFNFRLPLAALQKNKYLMKYVPYPEFYGLTRVTSTINMQFKIYFLQHSASQVY
jgi:hypothetical protein